jgi:flagellar protein FlaG
MSVDNIGTPARIGPLVPTNAPARPAATAASARAARVDTVELSIPASPPEEVRDAVGVASARVGELARENRTLHFEKDDTSGRVIIQVRDLDGNVLKTIPPSKALAIMSGEEL